jgi:hypothetical protein
MGGINTGRWFIGGIVAGIVLAIVDFVVNGMLLGARWNEVMTALNLPAAGTGAFITFIIVDLLIGLALVWIYTGIRPRYGAGVTTAVYAGLAGWVVGGLAPTLSFMAVGVVPSDIGWIGLIVGLISYVVATVIGAYLYQEEA